MNLRILFSCALTGLALTSCGYHLGGMKPARMDDMHTFCVEMFENNTVQPSVGVYMTTAVTNALQSDGTYRLAPRNEADFIVKGTVSHISRDSLTTSTKDSYISTQIGVTVHVQYEIVNRKTGIIISKGTESEQASYFNQNGSTITAMESALFYATSRVADDIVLNITTR